MISLPSVPEGSAVPGIQDVEQQMLQEIAALKAKKMTPDEFEAALRALAYFRTNMEDPEVLSMLIREIHHGSPHVIKPSLVKFLVSTEGRVPEVYPEGYDDSMTLKSSIGGEGSGNC